jgi:hypothetical protein
MDIASKKYNFPVDGLIKKTFECKKPNALQDLYLEQRKEMIYPKKFIKSLIIKSVFSKLTLLCKELKSRSLPKNKIKFPKKKKTENAILNSK